MTMIARVNKGKGNLVAGIIMLLLGIFIWFNPVGTMLALAFYIGIGFMLVGSFYVLASIDIKSGWYLLVGVLDFVVGLILMSNLGVTAVTLPVILALWCLTVGVIQIIGAFEIKRYGLPWGWSIIMGSVGIVFGLLIFIYPTIGAVAISTVIGLYAFLFGILQLAEYYMSKNSYQIIIEAR